jgi:hypothetical protein
MYIISRTINISMTLMAGKDFLTRGCDIISFTVGYPADFAGSPCESLIAG